MTFWNFKNSDDKDEAEMQVYGDIGEWLDVDSRRFTQELKAITAKRINVRINSGGGSVFTAQAILSSLRRHPADIYVYIDGIAASAATIIAMAGDLIIMPSNAMMMIHNPSTVVWGESEEMRKGADMLDKVRETIIAAYRDRTGIEEDRLVQMMDDETWMTAAEAVEMGFADEIEQQMSIAASINGGSIVVNGLAIDAKRYRHMPTAWAKTPGEQQPKDPNGQPGNMAGETEEEKERKPMNLEELKAKHPELYAQIVAQGEQAGAEKERERIMSIQDMSMPGHDDVINKAIKDGTTAEVLAVALIKAEKAKKTQYLDNRQDDASSLNNLGSSDSAPPENSTQEQDDAERKRLAKAAAKGFNSKRK
jgi:ATP-dependent Clp protease protease subunit